MIQYKQLYIDGEWVDSHNPTPYQVINPATEQVLTEVHDADAVDIDRAVRAACKALPVWAQSSGAERAEYLRRLAEKLRQRKDELASLISAELGMPRHLAMDIQVLGPIEGLESFIEHARSMDATEQIGNSIIVKEPIGVCALICPWNYPLHQLLGKVAPALAAGCTMVAKPSIEAPLSAFVFAEICAEVGLPAGVFNLATGAGKLAGEALCTHRDVDMISFTGSNQAGSSVIAASSDSVKRVCLELGGKSPLIITDDADLQQAVEYGVTDVMCNSGQTCTALTRMLIPRSRYEEAIGYAQAACERIKVGSPEESDSFMGPMVTRQQQMTVQRYIQSGIDEGARLIAGGLEKPPGLDKGFYVMPTLFADVDNQMKIAREEIFGPVLCLIPYNDIDDAVRIANDTIFGLSSAVWARNQEQGLKIAKQLKAGQVFINGGAFNYHAPFGGYKQSGNGREWGEDGLKEFIEVKAIQI